MKIVIEDDTGLLAIRSDLNRVIHLVGLLPSTAGGGAMNAGFFESREKHASSAELETKCFAAQAASRLGHFVLAIFPSNLVLPLLAAMREKRIFSVKTQDDAACNLSAQVSSEFLKVVDEFEGFDRLQAGEQYRRN
jgi:hypothetical protein